MSNHFRKKRNTFSDGVLLDSLMKSFIYNCKYVSIQTEG